MVIFPTDFNEYFKQIVGLGTTEIQPPLYNRHETYEAFLIFTKHIFITNTEISILPKKMSLLSAQIFYYGHQFLLLFTVSRNNGEISKEHLVS